MHNTSRTHTRTISYHPISEQSVGHWVFRVSDREARRHRVGRIGHLLDVDWTRGELCQDSRLCEDETADLREGAGRRMDAYADLTGDRMASVQCWQYLNTST